MIRHRVVADLCAHACEKIDRTMQHSIGLLDNQLEGLTFAFTVVIKLVHQLGEFLGDDNEAYEALNDDEKLIVMTVLLRQFACYSAGTFDAEKLKAIVVDMNLTIKALPNVQR